MSDEHFAPVDQGHFVLPLEETLHALESSGYTSTMLSIDVNLFYTTSSVSSMYANRFHFVA